MNLDLQKPPRDASPFLINTENDMFPEGIKGGRRFFFLSLAATLKQRSSSSAQFCVCFDSATNKMNLWGVSKEMMIRRLGGQLIPPGGKYYYLQLLNNISGSPCSRWEYLSWEKEEVSEDSQRFNNLKPRTTSWIMFRSMGAIMVNSIPTRGQLGASSD